MLRKAFAILIFAAAALAMHATVIVPYRCNLIEGSVSQALENVWATPHTHTARMIAAQSLARLQHCLAERPERVNLSMLAGGALQILGRHEAAIAIYENALRYDRRPELYMALGLSQLDAGIARETAVTNFVRAAEFQGLTILRNIPDVEARWAAYKRAGAEYDASLAALDLLDTRNRLANGDFGTPGPAGPRTSSNAAGVSPSAAARWSLFNRVPGLITSVLNDSPRGGGRKALRVTVASAHSGIYQKWPTGRSAGRVRTSASIYVVRGRIYVGSGNAPPFMNAVSAATGRWELLEGPNVSCPASMTVLYAADEGGAEFYVENVTATQTFAAPPCGL